MTKNFNSISNVQQSISITAPAIPPDAYLLFASSKFFKLILLFLLTRLIAILKKKKESHFSFHFSLVFCFLSYLFRFPFHSQFSLSAYTNPSVCFVSRKNKCLKNKSKMCRSRHQQKKYQNCQSTHSPVCVFCIV